MISRNRLHTLPDSETSPRALRAAYIKSPSHAPTTDWPGLKQGALVRLGGEPASAEYIVLRSRTSPEGVITVELFGGKDNQTRYRSVPVLRIGGGIRVPKTTHGKGLPS